MTSFDFDSIVHRRDPNRVKISGVYVIFGQAGRVYVGQSNDILRRQAVDLARRLGLDWTIVCYMTGSTRAQRQAKETLVADVYRRSGATMVSMDTAEVAALSQARIDFKARSEKIRAAWNDPGRRAAQAKRIEAINARRTPESRSEAIKKGWVKRRLNPSDGQGKSQRTQQRHRAQKDLLDQPPVELPPEEVSPWLLRARDAIRDLGPPEE